ncbi:unnamed protein product [Symbiodinium sp. KB8]|nr:unnamed protein product [Symbiodinium sp. KB8]
MLLVLFIVLAQGSPAHGTWRDEAQDETRPTLQLPDYECHGAGQEARDVHEAVMLLLSAVELQGASPSNQKVWQGNASKFAKVPAVFEDICPFGWFLVRLSHWTSCVLAAWDHPSCKTFRSDPIRLTKLVLGAYGNHYGLQLHEELVVFWNTRWSHLLEYWVTAMQRLRNWQKPFAAAFDSTALRGIDCDDSSEVQDFAETDRTPLSPTWTVLRRRLEAAYHKGDENSQRISMHLTMFMWQDSIESHLEAQIKECPLGMLAVSLHRLVVYLRALSEQVPLQLSHVVQIFLKVEDAFPDLLPVLFETQWPLLTFLNMGAQIVQWRSRSGTGSYQTKPFTLDFFPTELLTSEAERKQLSSLATSGARLLGNIRQRLVAWPSDTYQKLLKALLRYLDADIHRPSSHHIVFMTTVYGQRYAKYLSGWLRRAAALGHLPRMLVFCLDAHAKEECDKAHLEPSFCIAGKQKTAANKFHMMAAIVNLGFDVLYLDFDVVLFKDPLPEILSHWDKAELLLTRDFGSECLNIGVVYAKAHADTAEFLQELIVWLWNHPYEFCQKAFAGMMGQEDIQCNDLFGDPVRAVPRWGFLESLNLFVTSTVYNGDVQGWTGDIDKIIIFHFLDSTGDVNHEFALKGGYVNLFDAFYDNPQLNLSDVDKPLYEQDHQIRALLMESRQLPPTRLWPCLNTDPASLPEWKKIQRNQILNRSELRPVEM